MFHSLRPHKPGSMPGFPVLHCLPESAQTHVSHWVRWYHPTISFSVAPFSSSPSLSQHQGLFQWVDPSHRVTKVLEFQLWRKSFQYSGLISFRTDWFDLLDVQGTLKSLLQDHSSKASVLWCSVFFMVQLLHPYMTTGKTIALTRWTFVGKVMSLLFNTV